MTAIRPGLWKRVWGWVEGLGPYQSLALVVVPVCIVEPLKLVAVAIAGKGHWFTGTAVMAAIVAGISFFFLLAAAFGGGTSSGAATVALVLLMAGILAYLGSVTAAIVSLVVAVAKGHRWCLLMLLPILAVAWPLWTVLGSFGH